jgi:hypothetical protein
MPEYLSAVDNALRLAAYGCRLIPVFGADNRRCGCGRSNCEALAKHPPLKGWKDAATTDPDVIVGWLKHWPNYGIVTDKFFAVDIDVRHGGDKSWRSLTSGENIKNAVPHTWEVITGSGGRHII